MLVDLLVVLNILNPTWWPRHAELNTEAPMVNVRLYFNLKWMASLWWMEHTLERFQSLTYLRLNGHGIRNCRFMMCLHWHCYRISTVSVSVRNALQFVYTLFCVTFPLFRENLNKLQAKLLVVTMGSFCDSSDPLQRSRLGISNLTHHNAAAHNITASSAQWSFQTFL